MMRELPQSRASWFLTWMERLFIMAGIAMFVWCALLVSSRRRTDAFITV